MFKIKERLLSRLLWIWVGAATAAYVYQFRGIVRPALDLLGLS